MFAYCLNNPENYIDPYGDLAFPGEIHNEVVKRIAQKYGYYKEQSIRYKFFGLGRADLISSDGQVWDVKRDKPRQISNGEKQVKKYVENTWARFPDTPLRVGGNEIESDSFYYKSGLTTYRVTYRNAGNGVIAYDYWVSDYDYETLKKTTTVIGISALAAVATYFLGKVVAFLVL